LKRKGEASGSWIYAQATARQRRAITNVAATGNAPVAIRPAGLYPPLRTEPEALRKNGQT
jgi:hypothetical protein